MCAVPSAVVRGPNLLSCCEVAFFCSIGLFCAVSMLLRCRVPNLLIGFSRGVEVAGLVLGNCVFLIMFLRKLSSEPGVAIIDGEILCFLCCRIWLGDSSESRSRADFPCLLVVALLFSVVAYWLVCVATFSTH